MKIKKGDTVLVIAGDYKGKRGEVVRAIPKEQKVVVKGVNIAKKHAKPRRTGRRVTQAGIIEVEMPIHVSNVMLIAPSGNPVRVNYRFVDGVKKRYGNKTDEVLD